MLFLPPANVVWEGYVFTGVCLSTGGWVSQDALQATTLPGMENPPPRMENPPGWRTPPDGEPPLDGGTPPPVNVRAVRILLECILVSNW